MATEVSLAGIKTGVYENPYDSVESQFAGRRAIIVLNMLKNSDGSFSQRKPGSMLGTLHYAEGLITLFKDLQSEEFKAKMIAPDQLQYLNASQLADVPSIPKEWTKEELAQASGIPVQFLDTDRGTLLRLLEKQAKATQSNSLLLELECYAVARMQTLKSNGKDSIGLAIQDYVVKGIYRGPQESIQTHQDPLLTAASMAVTARVDGIKGRIATRSSSMTTGMVGPMGEVDGSRVNFASAPTAEYESPAPIRRKQTVASVATVAEPASSTEAAANAEVGVQMPAPPALPA